MSLRRRARANQRPRKLFKDGFGGPIVGVDGFVPARPRSQDDAVGEDVVAERGDGPLPDEQVEDGLNGQVMVIRRNDRQVVHCAFRFDADAELLGERREHLRQRNRALGDFERFGLRVRKHHRDAIVEVASARAIDRVGVEQLRAFGERLPAARMKT
jgi:hypothetical protein